MKTEHLCILMGAVLGCVITLVVVGKIMIGQAFILLFVLGMLACVIGQLCEDIYRKLKGN